MTGMQYKENETLREECMTYLYKIEDIRKFTITTTIAVLTLVSSQIWEDFPTLYLIPSIAITLSLISTLGMERRIKEITSYRIVFLENNDAFIRWARAVTKYDTEYRENNKLTQILIKYDYTILSLLCIVIYISKFINTITQLINAKTYIKSPIMLLVVLIILFIYTIFLSSARVSLDSQDHFNKLINKWKEIKGQNLDF